MKQNITDKLTGISYTLVGDYYLPDLVIPAEEENRPIGRYGRLHKKYLESNRSVNYMNLVTSGKLNSYLVDIDEQAQDMIEHLVKQMAEQQGVTEQLKANDQMAWVGAMNNIRHSAEDVALHDIVHSG